MTWWADVLNKAIYDHLHGNSALTALLSGTDAIYFGQAPVNTALPYVVYSIAGGGDDNLTPTESVDVGYQIQGVAKTASKAGAIAGAVHDALHEVEPNADAPWHIYNCRADNATFMYPENVEHDQYWHAGDVYRIRASQ